MTKTIFRTLFFLLAIAPVLSAQAQKQPFDDLLIRYVDEKYEDCVSRAEAYTLKDNTKKEPLPYLYMCMCLYEMSKVEKYRNMDDYKRADRESLKWAAKFRKRDSDNSLFEEYKDFFSSLNTMAQDWGISELDQPKGLSRAKQTFTSMTKYHPENPGPWLMLAVCNYKANSVQEGDGNVKKFKETLQAAGAIEKMPADQQAILKAALIRYATYLNEKGDRGGAKEAIVIGAEAYKNDAEYKVALEEFN